MLCLVDLLIILLYNSESADKLMQHLYNMNLTRSCSLLLILVLQFTIHRIYDSNSQSNNVICLLLFNDYISKLIYYLFNCVLRRVLFKVEACRMQITLKTAGYLPTF